MNEADAQDPVDSIDTAARGGDSATGQRERTGPGWGCAVLAFFGFLVIYILSPPVVVIVWQKLSPGTSIQEMESTLEIVYFPLVYLLERSEWARQVWMLYVELFDM